jgi:hypothetical protein
MCAHTAHAALARVEMRHSCDDIRHAHCREFGLCNNSFEGTIPSTIMALRTSVYVRGFLLTVTPWLRARLGRCAWSVCDIRLRRVTMWECGQQCPAGFFCNSSAMLDASTANVCPEGYYCPAGSCNVDGTAFPCGASSLPGWYCAAGSASPNGSPCPAGRFTPGGGVPCSRCAEGYYCGVASTNATAARCGAEPPGRFCANGSSTPFGSPCPAVRVQCCVMRRVVSPTPSCFAGRLQGQFSPGGGVACTLCSARYACPAGSSNGTAVACDSSPSPGRLCLAGSPTVDGCVVCLTCLRSISLRLRG